MNNGVTHFLFEHASIKPVSFHMPGHKGARFYKHHGYGKFMRNVANYDITEIAGADNLFQTEGIIKTTAEKYADLYEVEKSYLLVNGTSGGIIASILATVPKGGKLIMARNCHKSVFNALTLGDIQPVYAFPTEVKEYGISGAVQPEEVERLLEENPEAKAVILPSPNYYGICSDIKGIAKVCHRHDAVLIVDQAHGAHLKFFSKYGVKNMPKSAEESGADLIINSVHKTLASLTQSAVLNVNSDRVDLAVLEDKLQAIESTSPSYLLMASLDINADIIKDRGPVLFKLWNRNVRWFYKKAAGIPMLKVMTLDGDKKQSRISKFLKKTEESDYKPGELDPTKINLDMGAFSINGARLEEMLIEYGIYPELSTGNILMCMSGIGNRKRDFKKLYDALAYIAYSNRENLIKLSRPDELPAPEEPMQLEAGEVPEDEGAWGKDAANEGAWGKDHPEADVGEATGASIWSKKRKLTAVPQDKVWTDIDFCEGRICASSIIPYPPGIPLVCPGEKLDYDDIEYIKRLRNRGHKVIGINEHNEICVGR